MPNSPLQRNLATKRLGVFKSTKTFNQYGDIETRQSKRRSSITQNKHLRQMRRVCQQNPLHYRYMLTDNGFSSKENMMFIRQDMGQGPNTGIV